MFRVRPGSGSRPISLLVTQLLAATALMRPALCAGGQAAPPGRAFVDRYCVSCHSERLHTGDMVLEGLDPSHPAENAATWEKVLRKVRVGAMPPSGARQPDRAGAESFVAELQTTLD